MFDGGQCSSTKATEVDYLGCMFGRRVVFVSISGTLRALLQERWEVYMFDEGSLSSTSTYQSKGVRGLFDRLGQCSFQVLLFLALEQRWERFV